MYVSYHFTRKLVTQEMDACAYLSGYISGGSTGTIQCKHNTWGRFVIVHIEKAKYPLTLCEVEVYGVKGNTMKIISHKRLLYFCILVGNDYLIHYLVYLYKYNLTILQLYTYITIRYTNNFCPLFDEDRK